MNQYFICPINSKQEYNSLKLFLSGKNISYRDIGDCCWYGNNSLVMGKDQISSKLKFLFLRCSKDSLIKKLNVIYDCTDIDDFINNFDHYCFCIIL